ncbi:MAG: type 4a pilus biogenesis protein PilO [bacterium]|nr:type 4a pilus biogenesis protein PilO [bacterium]
MRYSVQRSSSLLIAGGMIVGAIAVFLILIQPAYTALQSTRGEIDGLTSVLDEQKIAFERVKTLQEQYQNEQESFKSTIGAMLPIGFQESEALNHVIKLAEINRLTFKSANVTVAALASQPAPEGAEAHNILKPIGNIVFQLHLMGTYEDLRNVLKNIESNVRIMEISNMGIAPAGTSDQDIYLFDITVTTYYQST